MVETTLPSIPAPILVAVMFTREREEICALALSSSTSSRATAFDRGRRKTADSLVR